MSIIEAIKQGEQGIIEHLKSHEINDSDLVQIKRYQNIVHSSVIKEFLRKKASSVILNESNIASQTSLVLLEKFLSCSKEYQHLIIKELSERETRQVVKFSLIGRLIKKSKDPSLVLLLTQCQKSNYQYFCNFSNLDNEHKFDDFFALQNSGAYSYAIVSFGEFKKSLLLWNTKQEEIKKCLRFFAPVVVDSLADITDDIHIALIKDYISHHTSKIEAKIPGYDLHKQSQLISLSKKIETKDYLLALRRAIKVYNKE